MLSSFAVSSFADCDDDGDAAGNCADLQTVKPRVYCCNRFFFGVLSRVTKLPKKKR